jgi:hypothetical protein
MKKKQKCYVTTEDGEILTGIYLGSSGKAGECKVKLPGGVERRFDLSNVHETVANADAWIATKRRRAAEKTAREEKYAADKRREELRAMFAVEVKHGSRLSKLAGSPYMSTGYGPGMFGHEFVGGPSPQATVDLRELSNLINEAEMADRYAEMHKRLVKLVLLVEKEIGQERVDELISKVLT